MDIDDGMEISDEFEIMYGLLDVYMKHCPRFGELAGHMDIGYSEEGCSVVHSKALPYLYRLNESTNGYALKNFDDDNHWFNGDEDNTNEITGDTDKIYEAMASIVEDCGNKCNNFRDCGSVSVKVIKYRNILEHLEKKSNIENHKIISNVNKGI